MLRRLAGTIILGAVALAGCTAAPEAAGPTGPASRAHVLWRDRAAYVGDNSKVVALAADAGFGSMGTHTLALHTATPPYAVTVAYSVLEKPFDTVDFTAPATLLLGTVANLDRVDVTAGTGRFGLTAAEASAELGFDVKELGLDEARLTAYVTSLDD